jgi:hypothetical protein
VELPNYKSLQICKVIHTLLNILDLSESVQCLEKRLHIKKKTLIIFPCNDRTEVVGVEALLAELGYKQ